ncbi:hypothetical protein HKCCSP123_07590 [Rhodobacterales bacterium HKCCSP123]|nr:hypothetical protein [Rhodobacterales bacterium HKCCSP123]
MDDITQRIVDALLGVDRKSKRGRPRKSSLEDDDTRRAFLVVWFYTQYPGQFRNRREVIRYLKFLSKIMRDAGHSLELEGIEPEWQEKLRQAGMHFPDRELEQSVSRGMNKNGGLLKKLEKLAKNST